VREWSSKKSSKQEERRNNVVARHERVGAGVAKEEVGRLNILKKTVIKMDSLLVWQRGT
jgi:hypothetical protein